MRRFNLFLTGIIFILALTTVMAQENLSDPYEILNNHFQALGGLDKLKAERSSYFEATLSVAGLKGTFEVWIQKPDRSRVKVDLKVFKMTTGDNGEYEWVVDTNDKLQLISNPDEATIKRKKVQNLMAEYKHADPNSDIFTLSLSGIEKVEEQDCYVIKIDNSISNDQSTYYINNKTFLLDKSISIAAEKSNESYYKDYREVDGIKVAFYIKQIDLETGQEETIEISQYQSNLEIDPAIFDAPSKKSKDFHFETDNGAENLSFKFVGNHLFIPVTVACQTKYWALDTGAGISVIDKKFAGDLGLELEGDLKGSGAGGTVDIQFATLPPFSLPGIQFDEQTVGAIDLTDINKLLSIEVVGILGFDFLSRFVTKVDYANELVSFYDPDFFEYSGDGSRLDVHLKNNVFMVKANLDETYSGTWLFDLGAGSVSLNGAYALKNGLTDRKGIEALGRGAANTFKIKRIKAEAIELAGFRIDEPRISFSYGGTDTVSRSDEIGTLGNSLFRHFVIYCDYLNERLIIEKGQNFNQTFPEDHSGLQLSRGDHENIEILNVSPGTPGDKAGLQEGDILKSINDIDIEYLGGLLAVRDMFKKSEGTKYSLVVYRDGREKKAKIKLADLY